MIEEFRFDIRVVLAQADAAASIARQLEGDPVFVRTVTENLKAHDRLAVYVSGTFTVDSVVLTEAGVARITYSFDWEAHHGCLDLHIHERATDSVSGRVTGGELVVTRVLPEQRSTLDEL